MTRWLLPVVFTLWVVAPARAWNEPDSFLGIKLGALPKGAIAALRQRADDATCDGKDDFIRAWKGTGVSALCTATVPIGHARLHMDFRFNETGFFWSVGAFDSSAYETIRSVFIEKYGAATTVRRYPLVAGAGATLTNEFLEWSGARIIIRLTRLGNAAVTLGKVEVLSRGVADKWAEESRRAIKKGKDDL